VFDIEKHLSFRLQAVFAAYTNVISEAVTSTVWPHPATQQL